MLIFASLVGYYCLKLIVGFNAFYQARYL
jgi:hypothetical protein